MTRLARGTAPVRQVTRSRLVLALKEAEARGDQRGAADLREVLGVVVVEKNDVANGAALQLDRGRK